MTTTTTTTETEGFAGLLTHLDSLSTMSKAMCADGEGDGKEKGKDKDGLAKIEGAAEDGKEEGEGDDMMGKALQVTLADGSVVEAFDGTAMMKSLSDRLVATETNSAEFMKGMAVAVDVLTSMQKVVVAQAAKIEAQDVLLKSLQDKVGTIGAQGSGRRALVNILEKTATTIPGGGKVALDRNAILAKALTAQKRGDLDAVGVARIESRLNSNMELPADLAAIINA
jgi:hypothetical protein